MKKYKLCPVCELNYILEDEDMCSLCKHSSESMSDLIVENEMKYQENLEAYSKKREDKEQYLAIRYNRPQRR